jgi:hypothetical protein
MLTADATPPPSVDDRLRTLRAWIMQQSAHSDPGQRIRDEFQRSALSAALRRLVGFGVEPALNRYNARELLQFQLMVAGKFSAYLARITWTRALVDGDDDVLRALATSGLVDEQVAWTAEIPDDLAGMEGEELHVARLVLGRRAPQRLTRQWLWEVPEDHPGIGAAMALLLLQHQPDCAPSIREWLQRRPDTLAFREPDELLAALVAASSEHPQTVLAPFAGWYGDRTVIAAAAWHLEHNEPRPAIELCQSIRPYGPCLESARLIAGLASLEIGDIAQAKDLLAAMEPGPDATVLRLRLAARAPEAVSTAELQSIASLAAPERPQTFFTAIQLLVQRRELDAARELCRLRGDDFRAHKEIAALIAVVNGAKLGIAR